jgi:hypothetical protein
MSYDPKQKTPRSQSEISVMYQDSQSDDSATVARASGNSDGSISPVTEFSNDAGTTQETPKTQPVGKRLLELFEENIAAKIIRTAINSLENNVRLSPTLAYKDPLADLLL